MGSRHRIVSIGDVARESRAAVDPQEQPNAEVNYLGLEHIEPLTGDLVDFHPRHGRDVRSRSKVFHAGDVLYGRLRPYLNKVYLAEGEVSEGICSGEFLVLLPDRKKARPAYLRCILASPIVSNHVSRFQSGAALPRIPVDDFLGIKIPLPSLELQDELVSRVAKLNAERSRLRARLQEVQNKLIQATAHVLGSPKS